MKRLCIVTAVLLLLCTMPASAQTVRVQIEGEVVHAGARDVPLGTRRSAALLIAQPSHDAYATGAALLRSRNLIPQTRLKAGLLYDLQTLTQQGGDTLVATAQALHDWLDAQPVTGREPNLPLEPRRLELDDNANKPLEDGDRFIYPQRPRTIRVLGAVKQPCTLTHVPLQDARRYLRNCPINAVAERDSLFVIQPDGQVQAIGIAAWNLTEAQSLAPGAIVFVPLAQRRVDKIDPDFNADFATFLATQLLPTQDASP
jgi:hypothetical protein